VAIRIDTLTVLVLDDHRFMQQVLGAILTGLGIRGITTALAADEAARLMESREFDLVIADYRLDGISGAEFARLVRASRAGDKFVPIIACTADTTPRVVRELRDAGVDEILAKPVSSFAVWSKLTAVVNSRRPFVAAPSFFGPDRRRRSKPLPAGRHDRRKLVLI
jgi:two-component system, chemotaxis family, chemotaxis protein CheY